MIKPKLGIISVIFALNVFSSTTWAEPIYRENWIVPEGVFPANHGSTLVELPSGEIKACWYAGTAEKKADVQIYCSDLDSKTDVWSAPTVAIPRQQKAGIFPYFKATTLGNPALYLDEDQKLWLFYANVSIFNGWSGAHVDYKVSKDFGKTWGRAHPFQSFFGNLSRNKPIKLDNQRFMVPLYHELIGRDGYTCTVTPKRGRVWDKECHQIFGRGEIQPTLVKVAPNRLFAYMRVHSKENMRMAEFDFEDNSWSKTSDTNLPNSDSAVDAVTTTDGLILIAYNDSYTDRFPLSLAYSADGRNFTKVFDVETKPGRQCSYPALIRTRDGMYHLSYTYDFRSAIKHVSFNEEWLRAQINTKAQLIK